MNINPEYRPDHPNTPCFTISAPRTTAKGQTIHHLSFTCTNPPSFYISNIDSSIYTKMRYLPDEILDMVCGELRRQRDFGTLFRCACSGNRLVKIALKNLYQ